ncbi:MAG: DUF2213 domain-containing protein [Gammaproteobacteria bacterium]|nr:DUF2213 domain-containing protein [Gammaproteobacteria bacterium]
MTTMKIAINSKTSGKFRTEVMNGRDHLVTEMVSIVGNSVMNGGLYPDDEVTNSFMQLDSLPAPNGHPTVNGNKVSAFHPAAVNAHNIGGFIKNPRKEGLTVINEFWLDTAVANQSDDGMELISRIESGGKVGVSTGLNLIQEITNGTAEDGSEFTWIARDMEFDHVAILLNEKAAGSHVGTELKLNEDETVQIVALNELGVESLKQKLNDKLEFKFGKENWVWIIDVFPDQKQLIYELDPREGGESRLWKRGYGVDANEEVSLLDDTREVERVVTFEETGGLPVTNVMYTQRSLSMKDEKKKADGKQPTGTPGEAGKEPVENAAPELTVETCIEFLKGKSMRVVNQETDEAMQFFIDNQEQIKSVIKQDEDRLAELRKEVVENSELNEDDVKNLSEENLKKIHNSLSLPTDNSLRAGGQRAENSSDHLDDYTAYSDKDDKGGSE